MELSVVIPARNAACSIDALLDSLHGQTLAGLAGCEFIVVDDASTDSTPQLLAARPWLRVVRHDRQRGAGAARNSGARVALGRILVFLDADTWVPETDFLQRCVDFFAQHPDDAAVSGCYYPRNPSSGWFGRYLDACEAAMHERALDGPAPGTLNGCVCALRKTVFDALGAFSEDPRVVLEDPDLGCRLAAAGYQHWFSGELRVAHRQPGLWHYLKELRPRTRHYVHLIRHYGIYNEAMGGRAEGWDRSLLLLGVLLGLGGVVDMAWAGAGLPLLAAGLWRSRALWRRLAGSGSSMFIAAAMLFHLLTTLTLVAGTLQGLADGLRFRLRRSLIDGAVVVGYLRSLLTPNAPGQLIQFVTHRCNARCAHCFDTQQRQSIGAAQELDAARIRRVAASAGPLAHVSLTGGEPLLRDDIAAMVAAYYAAGVRSFSLNSNGSRPDRIAALLPQLAQAAPWGRIIVTLSVDGIGAAHDERRGLPGLYVRLEQSLAVLLQARQWLPQLRVHACMTLSAANRHDVDAVLAALSPLRLDQLEFARLRGEPAAPALRGVTDAEYAAACGRLAAANGASRGLARLFARLDQTMARIMRQPERAWPCGPCLAGRRLAVIQADGTVLPCEMLRNVRPGDAARHDNFVLGRLGDHGDDLGALLASPLAQRLRDYIRSSACRCSFECAIFTTMAYRPWRLWRFLVDTDPEGYAAPAGADANPMRKRRNANASITATSAAPVCMPHASATSLTASKPASAPTST